MFSRIKYPDGQISAKSENVSEFFTEVRERINSYEDLFYVRSIADVIELSGGTCSLFIPCMFGQRSDRRFSKGQSFDLKLICDVINSCNFSSVTILDPHSDVCMALINRSLKITSLIYVREAMLQIQANKAAGDATKLVLVSPDAGAYKKVFEYGQTLSLSVTAANKHRDLKGNIDLVFVGDVKDRDCLIVDDYCDGGRTFVTLATKLKEQGARKVYLYITHGLFSNGFNDLYTVVDHIYCTNSIYDLPKGDFLTQFKVI